MKPHSRRKFLQASCAALSAPSLSAQAQPVSAEKRFLGVTVFPEYIQSEGVDGVLDNLLRRVGANAVAISPYVMAQADKQTGNREPPADAGAGSVRLLDRPLWGKREVWVTTAPSFEPQRELYKGLRYQPPQTNELTRTQGSIIEQFIQESKLAGLKVYLQIQAAIPPGYRVQFGGPVDEDKPRLPDGSIQPRRLAKNGSLASPEIIAYEHALIRDLLSRYPGIDGIRFDWPEYPPYFLDSCFVDFGPHAKAAAQRLGFDFEQMQRTVGGFYKKIHGGLTDADLKIWGEGDGGRFELLRMLANQPGILEFVRFKATLVEELVAGFRRVMTDAGSADKEVMPNAFPPPWTIVTGMDFRRVARHASAISSKLYTMHWPMMIRFYGDRIMKANPGLDNRLLTKALVNLLDIADDGGLDKLEDYAYPAPDVSHPVGPQAQRRKIRQAQREAGDTPVYVLAHGYGPLDDFRKRMEVAHQAGEYGLWVNRYAYLTDEKLDVIGDVCN